jgi:hypothetical protein
MTYFESKYFRKFAFTDEQVDRYVKNALRDLRIAHESRHNEVIFNYAYTALIKAGIALLAGKGGVKVRSVPGHHIKIVEKMSEILADETVSVIGNAMRMKRNEDFYGGGIFVSDKEASEYLNYIEQVLETVRKNLDR